MKKIILAVASVLALGMLASCKQEITGKLDVTSTGTETQLRYGDTFSKTYYYTVEGKLTTKTTISNYSKASYTAEETAGSVTINETEYSVQDGKVGVTLTVSETYGTNNVTTYTYSFDNALYGKQTQTYRSTPSATATTSYYDTTMAASNLVFTVKKIDGKYYFKRNSDSAWVAIDDLTFDPTAATVDLSKLCDVAYSTTTYIGRTYNSDNKVSYLSKTVTEVAAPTCTLKLNKR